MLIRHVRGGSRDDVLQKAPRHLLIEEPSAVLGEDRRILNRFVHRQADEPAKQNVVVELLYQQPLWA